MRNIIQKLLTHPVNLFLIFDVLKELIVRWFKLWDCLFQLFGHSVEVLSKLINLITCLAVILCIKIQFTHLGRKPRQFTDRLCDTLRDHPDHQSAQSNDHKTHVEIKTVGDCNTLTNTLQRGTDQKIASISQFSPAFYILHSRKAVTYLLDHIAVILLKDFFLTFLPVQIVNISYQPGLQQILIASDSTYRLTIRCDHHPGKIILRAVLKYLIWDFCTAVSVRVRYYIKTFQILHRISQNFCFPADIIMFQKQSIDQCYDDHRKKKQSDKQDCYLSAKRMKFPGLVLLSWIFV